MSQELDLVAKSIQELEPAVQELAHATGALEPIRQLTTWAAEIIYYRRLPHKAKLMMDAAAKIRATGVPAHAVSDRTLRAVLEDGALEDDPEMRERWTNLLTNEAIGDLTPPSFLHILSQLEPAEARIIDSLVSDDGTPLRGNIDFYDMDLSPSQFDNLTRLGLLRLAAEMSGADLIVDQFRRPIPTAVEVTSLAGAFVTACRAPRIE